jgi:hypothetical protein
MKKSYLSCLIAVLVCALFSVTSQAAQAQGGKAKGAGTKVGSEEPLTTQAELAQVLVQVLGLARFLPANPSDQQCFAILMSNSIFPKGGWQAEKIVTGGDLARVIVQALKKQGEIKNEDSDTEWVDYLTKVLGVPMESVTETLYYVDPLSEPVAANVVSARTDPLVKRHRFDPVDETQYGVDMEFIARFLSRFELTDGEFRPKPVTPD